MSRLRRILWSGYIKSILILVGIHLATHADSVLTLDSAIAITILNNKEIQEASHQTKITRSLLKQSQAEFLPSLNFGISSTQPFSNAPLAKNGNSIATSLSSQTTLFDGFSAYKRYKKARLEYKGSNKTLAWKQQSVIFSVYSQYMQTVIDSEIVRITHENYLSQQQQLTRIEEFAKLGQRSRGDVLTQKAAVAQAELTLLNKQHEFTIAKMQLQQLIGNNSFFLNFSVQSPIHSDSIPLIQQNQMDDHSIFDLYTKKMYANQIQNLLQDFSIDTTVNTLKNSRADLQAEQVNLETIELSQSITQSSALPFISLSASIGTSYQSTNKTSTVISQLIDKNPNASVGIQLSVPLFDKLKTKYAVSTDQIKIQIAQRNLDYILQKASFDVLRAILDFQTAQKKVIVAQIEQDASKQALEATEARFAVQASTLTDLTQLQAQYMSAQNDKIQAMYTLHLRFVGIFYYTGNLAKLFPQCTVPVLE